METIYERVGALDVGSRQVFLAQPEPRPVERVAAPESPPRLVEECGIAIGQRKALGRHLGRCWGFVVGTDRGRRQHTTQRRCQRDGECDQDRGKPKARPAALLSPAP